MTSSESGNVVTLAYQDGQFRFTVEERTEDSLRGRFQWTDDEKKLLLSLIEQEDEDGEQPWYLDDDGYRLDDEKLFQMSPWCIVDGEACRKAVQRMMDCDTGESWFCVSPWFRIGDERNRRSSE